MTMMGKLIRGIKGYKDADPEEVAEIEDKVYDAATLATLVTVAVVTKLLVDNYQMKQQLKVIERNQRWMYMATLRR